MGRGRGSLVAGQMALPKEVRDSLFDLCLSRKQPEKIKAFQEVGTAQPKSQEGGRASCDGSSR